MANKIIEIKYDQEGELENLAKSLGDLLIKIIHPMLDGKPLYEAASQFIYILALATDKALFNFDLNGENSERSLEMLRNNMLGMINQLYQKGLPN